MRVLLTRAAEDAARTRTALESLGHTVLVSPVIAIEATHTPWPDGVVDVIAATSSQAFRVVAPDWGPRPAARRLIPLWLVGDHTMKAARAAGFHGPALMAANALGLAMETRTQVRLRVVYLAGRDRKPDIETALGVTDHQVATVEMYIAREVDGFEPRTAKALAADAVDVALHFSRRSAALFATLVCDAGIRPPRVNVCISADAASPLLEAGWDVVTAHDPTEASVVAAISELGATSQGRG